MCAPWCSRNAPIVRDPSSIAIGIILPVVLILLFGYGLSLDVNHVPIAFVSEAYSPAGTDLAAAFQLSPYFDVRLTPSMQEAERLMLARQVDGIVRLRPDYARQVERGDYAEVQILVHGTDANYARIVQSYVQGAVGQWLAQRSAQGNKRFSDRWLCKTACGSMKLTRALLSCPRSHRVDHDADRRLLTALVWRANGNAALWKHCSSPPCAPKKLCWGKLFRTSSLA